MEHPEPSGASYDKWTILFKKNICACLGSWRILIYNEKGKDQKLYMTYVKHISPTGSILEQLHALGPTWNNFMHLDQHGTTSGTWTKFGATSFNLEHLRFSWSNFINLDQVEGSWSNFSNLKDLGPSSPITTRK